MNSYPEEIQWNLLESNENTVVLSGNPYPIYAREYGRRKAPSKSGRRKAPTRVFSGINVMFGKLLTKNIISKDTALISTTTDEDSIHEHVCLSRPRVFVCAAAAEHVTGVLRALGPAAVCG